jgi:hypothetical protein
MAAALETEVTPQRPAGRNFAEQVRLWAELVDLSDALLRNWLRRHYGPSVDLESGYRRWYADRSAEHDRDVLEAAKNLYRRGVRHDQQAAP